MNTNTFLKNKLMLFASIIFCIQGFAQNQSMLLPVPGIYSTSTNDYEGCKIINFINPGNPVIYELPKHTFYVEGIKGRPHVEYDLEHADPSMDEKYLGQHPMFAQNIVHDKDGNLLFFIVDNNIYNRYGEAFVKYLPGDSVPIDDIFSYLHDGIMYDNWIDGSYYNRFNVENTHISIDPEIVIFPIYGECYKYGLVYFLFDNDAKFSASKLFYRTLTYYDENKIVLSNPIEISENFPINMSCSDYSNRGLAISEYREEYGNYLLFVHYYNAFYILTIDNTGNIDTNNIKDFIVIENASNADLFRRQYSTEMEVIKIESGSDTYYLVAMGSSYGDPNSSDALVTEFTLNYDSLNVVDKWAYYFPMNTSTTDPFFCEYIKGLEYDLNGNLYVTYRGQGQYKLYYHIAGSSNWNYIDMQDKYYNASNYQYSEIELGRDGNLYYLYSNENETSGGISRFNLNSLTWEENLFPDVINKVYFSHDYTCVNSDESKILLFADQIDGSDYVSYYETVDQQCCIDHIYYDTWPSQQYFDQNPVWTWSPGIGNNPFQSINGEILINEDVKIYSGKEVTIKNLKFKFNSNKKLIIEPGAKLVLDNSVLTSVDNCEQSIMWQGIEVWGNKDLSQYPQSNQGVVELKNGATIENARCAITTCQKDTDGNILWNYTGGIIHAKDANFINNRKAIEFLSYHNILPNGREIANSSYFYNCTFETNAQLSDPGTLPETFVSLYDVKGVKFFGCTFQNTAPPGVYSITKRGNGITSVDASYEIKPSCLTPYIYPCTEYQPNTFQNLYYGIDASNTNPDITLTIDGNNFDNNHRSIILKGINNATITKNNFDIGASIGNINEQTYVREAGEAGDVFNRSYSYGVYLKECSGYKVEENNFSTTHDGHAGIIVDNSGKNANEIYNNTFDNLAIGTQAQGVNAAGVWIVSKSSNLEDIGINVGQGLQFLCNQYYNISSADIAVTSGRIALNQGRCYDNNPALPAGNKFSHTCINTSDIHVNPDVSIFNYSHHSEPDDYVPQCYSSDKVTLHDCDIEYDSQISCPSHLNSGLTPVVLKQIINTNKLEIEKLISLIDNGETQTLLAQIHRDEEAEKIKNTLVSASPYLSDRVLLAAIKEKPTPLPPDILKEIIISNSPVTDTVMSTLNALKLPDDIQQQIQEVQIGTSARAELEQQISYIVSQTGIAENDLMRQYLNDTTINGIDSVIAYLETQTDLINKKQLVQAYLVANQCEKAKILLGQLPQENEEDINFYNFYNLLSDLCVSEKTYFELTSAQEQTVREIAESETSVSVNAQAILSLVYNEKFPEIIEELKFIIDLRNAPQQGETLGDNITKQIQFVKIYPNPAENTIIIELSAELDNKNISVEIYNYLGQKIIFYNLAGDLLNTLDVSDLSNGIYIFKILVGNKIIAREKVVIEK